MNLPVIFIELAICFFLVATPITIVFISNSVDAKADAINNLAKSVSRIADAIKKENNEEDDEF